MRQEAFSKLKALGDDRLSGLREIEAIKNRINDIELQVKDLLIREGGTEYLTINWRAISRDMFVR